MIGADHPQPADINRVRDVSRDHLRALEGLQPYPGRDRQRPLWMLHELARADRHRQLSVVAGVISAHKHSLVVTNALLMDRQLHTGPFTDGQVVAEYRLGVPRNMPVGQVDVTPNTTLSVIFDEQVAESRTVGEVLARLHNGVTDVLQSFAPDFPLDDPGEPIPEIEPT